MGIITISKEFASGGREVGEMVAKKLKLDYFDREIVKAVALKSRVPEMEADEFDEDRYNAVKVFFSRVVDPVITNKRYKELIALIPQKKDEEIKTKKRFTPYSCEVEGWLDSDIFKEMIETFVVKFAKKGDAVIVGRGSQYILQDYPSVLHVRIIAPLEYRIDRAIKYKGVDPKKAKKTIQEIDNRRRQYIKHYYNEDWADLSFYHVVINTGKMTFDNAVDVIASAYSRLEKKKK